MTYNVNENINLHLETKDEWLGNLRIKDAYVISSRIIRVQYTLTWKTLPSLTIMDFDNLNNMNVVMEEMIHQCLPDPDEKMYAMKEKKQHEYAWKYYLYDLLKNNES